MGRYGRQRRPPSESRLGGPFLIGGLSRIGEGMGVYAIQQCLEDKGDQISESIYQHNI